MVAAQKVGYPTLPYKALHFSFLNKLLKLVSVSEKAKLVNTVNLREKKNTYSYINQDIVQGLTFEVVYPCAMLRSGRCPYFKDLLLAAGSLATELRVRLATPGVDVPMFTSLLRSNT